MKNKFLAVSVLVLMMSVRLGAMTQDERRSYVDWMKKTLPDVPAWNEWQQKTGELPPDFDQLPRTNALPDPLQFLDGRPVKSAGDWAARKTELRGLFERYLLGSFPPKAKLGNVVLLDETKGEGFVTRNLRLEFGPQNKGSVRVRITLPEGAGKFPVLISPNLGGWAPALVRRGYISLGYAGGDALDDSESLKELYPDNDFAALPRRAWLTHVVIDYLETLPQVDAKKIALFGYSRDGKMVAIAAAFEERIAALVTGSTGVGGYLPWRMGGERDGGESLETTTRLFGSWFSPRARFFSGREDRLPVEANSLLSLVAPRPVFIEWGLNDEVSNGWAIEQAVHSAEKTYHLLGRKDGIGLMHVPGFHGGNDPEACLDWLDLQFGRSERKWVNDFVFPWDFEAWEKSSGEKFDASRFPKRGSTSSSTTVADWKKQADTLRQSIAWMLGEKPPLMPVPAGTEYSRRVLPVPPGPTVVAKGTYGNPGQLTPDVAAWVIGRGGPDFGWLEPEKNQVESRRIRFGFGVTGDLYLPANTPKGAKLPTVIWLHGFNYPLGYMWVYRRDLHPILALVKAGYAVFAYDQTGFGTRWNEGTKFYDRFPRWSQLGRMVEDARAAIDVLQADDSVDGQRVSVFGYNLGAAVGLYTAALDPRVKSVVAICPPGPWEAGDSFARSATVAAYSHDRALLPRLGLFAGHEAQIPYGFGDLVGLVAPRPVLIVQPSMDRAANPAAIHAAVEDARKIFMLQGAAANLSLDEPLDIARLPTDTQQRTVDWLKAHPTVSQ